MEGAGASYIYAAGTDRVSQQLVSGVARYAFGYDRRTNLSAIGKYDSAGTTIQQAVCLRHDALGRMVLYGTRSAAGVLPDATVCTSDAEVVSAVARFKYDARNRRIARQDVATGSWTYTISDSSGNPLSELALVSGSWVKVAVCATRACRAKTKRDYFEAYGDCLSIIVTLLKMPTGTVYNSDAFVNACARSCRDVTGSKEFAEKCLSCGSRRV